MKQLTFALKCYHIVRGLGPSWAVRCAKLRTLLNVYAAHQRSCEAQLLREVASTNAAREIAAEAYLHPSARQTSLN